MKQLVTLLEDQAKRKTIINECCDLIEAEVKKKNIIVKGVYKMVKAIKPGTIPNAVDGLLDDFVEKLQPFYENFQKDDSANNLRSFLGDRSSDVAEALLSVTDERADNSRHKTMVKGYKKLRPKGKEHVKEAVPGLGALLDRHIGAL